MMNTENDQAGDHSPKQRVQFSGEEQNKPFALNQSGITGNTKGEQIEAKNNPFVRFISFLSGGQRQSEPNDCGDAQ